MTTSNTTGNAPSSNEGGAFSFWDALVREAVGPFILVLEDEDGDEVEFPVPYPHHEDVADLDTVVTDVDVLYILLEEDEADRAMDLLEEAPVSRLQEAVEDVRAHYGILYPPVYGWAQLMKDLGKYGAALERDAMDVNLDLYDWIRRHEELPWDKLYRTLIDRSREGGWVEAARLMDEELALEQVKREQQRKTGAPAPSRRPPVVGWTRDRENLERTTELLEQVLHAVWAASPKFKCNGGKRPSGHARPELAYDKVKRYALYVEHDEMSSMLLGARHKPLGLQPLWETETDELGQ